MKILLDENIPSKVRFDFGKEFEVKSFLEPCGDGSEAFKLGYRTIPNIDLVFHSNDQLKASAVQTFAARNMQMEKYNQIIFKTI